MATYLPTACVPQTPAAARGGAPASDAVQAQLGEQEAGPLAGETREGVRTALAEPEGREAGARRAGTARVPF